MENKKTALIVEGGGQRGVFSFGITDTFINRNYDPFDIYMGVSNGVAVLCWYLIRETDNNLEKMLYAAKGDYLSYKNIFIGKDIIKFHQMYEDGEKMFKPNMEKIKNNLKGKDYIAVVTDAIEANAEYYSFGDGEWMPKMIASGTLPILVRTPSLIDGRRKFDGGVADPLPVEKAYEMGAKKIVVIRTYEKKFRRKLKIENYILNLIFATRYPENYKLESLKPMISFGASPRGSINLATASKCYAFLKHRGYVIPEDVRAVIYDVLRHRIGLTYEAEAENITSEEIITQIINEVEVP